MSAELTALLARVEAAEGPDRAIDGALCRHFDLPGCTEPDCLPDVFERCIARTEAGGEDSDIPSYTASLDAALALCERVLPGWRPTLHRLGIGEDHTWFATIQHWDGFHTAGNRSPALAPLAAMLKAKIAQDASPASDPTGAPDAPKPPSNTQPQTPEDQ